MTHTVAFPALGLEFDINRAIHIGSFTVYWYAIIIACGFLLAMLFFFNNCKRFGLDSDRAADVVFLTMILGIAGARAYYVIFNWSAFSGNIFEVFNIRGGGLGFYGGIIGGLLGVYIGSKIWKVPLKSFLDIVGACLFIGQGIGRWGNFVNGECFGINTDLPWGMTGTNITSYILSHSSEEMGAVVDPFLPVHPTFLYESLWCLIGFLIYLAFVDKRKFDGEMFAFYIGWNGFGRMFIEGLRTDSLMIGNFRVSQLLGAIMAVSMAMLILYIENKIKKSDNPSEYTVWAKTEIGQLQAEGKWDYKTNSPIKNNEEKTELDGEENGDIN